MLPKTLFIPGYSLRLKTLSSLVTIPFPHLSTPTIAEHYFPRKQAITGRTGNSEVIRTTAACIHQRSQITTLLGTKVRQYYLDTVVILI